MEKTISHLTTVELLRYFMEYCVILGKRSFPMLNFHNQPWHELFYELSKQKEKFPVLKYICEFDWDGPYPKVRNWRDDVVWPLMFTGVFYEPAGQTRMFLCQDPIRLPNILKDDYPELAEEMFKIASQIKGFFEE